MKSDGVFLLYVAGSGFHCHVCLNEHLGRPNVVWWMVTVQTKRIMAGCHTPQKFEPSTPKVNALISLLYVIIILFLPSA